MAIRPEMLTWARETAGLSLEDAARSIGLKNARGETGPNRLAKLESGDHEPKPALLEKMAKTYRRPLLVFYLNDPPTAADRGQDFRTLPGEERDNPELDALIRDIKARQELVSSVLEDEEIEPPNFVGKASLETPVRELAVRIQKRFEIDIAEFRAHKTVDDAFNYLRAKIEQAGVFVLLIGNLGSHHTNIPVRIFRGYASADRLAPMIVINDQDVKAAWSFTALHELVHLWLGETGISGVDASNKTERYCNDVAGEILVPAEDLRVFANPASFNLTVNFINEYAGKWHVSRPMVAFKLYRTGRVDHDTWRRLDSRFYDEFLEFQERKPEKQKSSEGGPNYYVVKRHRVGSALLGLVRRALDEGTLTYTKAGRVLGVKPRNVEPLLAPVRNRGLR
ncbi:MAG: XRE family transcriptional regulator [Acidobacteriaceae bacterium]